MLKVDLPGGRTGLLLAYWNMKVVHDNKKNYVPICSQVTLYGQQ